MTASSSSVALHAGCDEDVDPGEERGERPLPQELHLHVNQEISGLADLSLEVDGAGEAAHLAGVEVTLLVAFGDADGDVVAGVGGGRSYSEDLGRDDAVGLEAELMVRDADGQVLTVEGVHGTRRPFTAPEVSTCADTESENEVTPPHTPQHHPTMKTLWPTVKVQVITVARS